MFMDAVVKIPDDVKVKKDGHFLVFSGKMGEAKINFLNERISLELNPDTIIIHSKSESRKDKRLLETFRAHISNAIKGVKQGFKYKLKICSIHFPMTAKVSGDKVIIENFLGERYPRIAKIYPGVKVEIQKQDITLTGADLCAVSQSAANIEQAVRISGRDRRVYQDGIFITEKRAE